MTWTPVGSSSVELVNMNTLNTIYGPQSQSGDSKYEISPNIQSPDVNVDIGFQPETVSRTSTGTKEYSWNVGVSTAHYGSVTIEAEKYGDTSGDHDYEYRLNGNVFGTGSFSWSGNSISETSTKSHSYSSGYSNSDGSDTFTLAITNISTGYSSDYEYTYDPSISLTSNPDETVEMSVNRVDL